MPVRSRLRLDVDSRFRTAFLGCAFVAIPTVGCGGLVGADFDGWSTATRSQPSAERGSDGDEPGEEADPSSPGSGKEETFSDGGKTTGSQDAGSARDAGKDASTEPTDPGSCQGTVTPCADLEDKSSCLRQTGCSWSTPACQLSFNCTSIKTNVTCQATAGCATDFTTSTCQPAAGYCVGATRAQCESTSGCTLTGGCSGTPTACEDISDDVACSQQVGCEWP